MKLLFDESLSPRLVELLSGLFPESESALRNGLAGSGDVRILEYSCAGGFVLVSTGSDFERLLSRFGDANVVIPGSCNYPTEVAGEVLRRNAIRIAELPSSGDRLMNFDIGIAVELRPPGNYLPSQSRTRKWQSALSAGDEHQLLDSAGS